MKTCSIEGCGKRVYGHGWCNTHYQRWRRHGDPHVVNKTMPHQTQQALEEAIAYAGNDCLFWRFGTDSGGYGRIMVDGRDQQVHRLVCEAHNGPPPATKSFAIHSCGNGRIGCVTPQHLRWGTPKENSGDMILHGRSSRGAKHGQSFGLNDRQVLDIYHRAWAGENQSEIGARYGVTKGRVNNIKHGKSWAWLTGHTPYWR